MYPYKYPEIGAARNALCHRRATARAIVPA
jgi:hypothetical protein